MSINKEIVFCENCKHLKLMGGTIPICNYYKGLARPIDPKKEFCCYGKKAKADNKQRT